MLSKLFHKKTTSERPPIPADPKDWPISWRTVLFKEYPRFDAIPLPTDFLELKNLKEALENRHSTRIFDTKKEISLQELGTMLYYSAGIKDVPGKYKDATQEKKNKTKRFYPSGGARYPLETYLAVKRISGVVPGIYHYNLLNHSLEQLLDKEYLGEFDETLGYPWAKDAAVIFIITAVWNRNFVKYQDFGYNIVLIETGHMVENLLLTAESVGISYCPLAGFNNQKINTLLDIDEEDESSLYIVATGK
ncbi:MAG: SagB family peptide dehydrogenase [Parcubacteria group bacterium]|nr:SagB family peptide dehydrogenase [Parcubacteria group bacterium]